MDAGTPTKPEPVGVEQLSGAESANLDASRTVGRGVMQHSGRAAGQNAGVKLPQARGAAPPAGDAVDVGRLQVRGKEREVAGRWADGHIVRTMAAW